MTDPLIVGAMLGALIAIGLSLWPRRKTEAHGPWTYPAPDYIDDVTSLRDGTVVGEIGGRLVLHTPEVARRSDFVPLGVVAQGRILSKGERIVWEAFDASLQAHNRETARMMEEFRDGR